MSSKHFVIRGFQNLLTLLFWGGHLEPWVGDMRMLERHQLRTGCPVSAVDGFIDFQPKSRLSPPRRVATG